MSSEERLAIAIKWWLDSNESSASARVMVRSVVAPVSDSEASDYYCHSEADNDHYRDMELMELNAEELMELAATIIGIECEKEEV